MDRPSSFGYGLYTKAIMDRIVHDAVWFDSGSKNIRESELKNGLIRRF
jgi:hypothetical protein